MKKLMYISSFSDKNFLMLGMVCIGIGLMVFALSFVFDFAGIIALRGGLGLGSVGTGPKRQRQRGQAPHFAASTGTPMAF